MAYSSLRIANFFIKKSHSTGIELTPMKLLKLEYIAHGWHLGLYKTELIGEVVQAWKYGPVIESVYHEFKHYGDRQIDILYDTFGMTTLPSNEIFPFLDKIWEIYKNKNGIQLSALTHEKGTPWDIVYNERGGKNRTAAIIPNDLIKDYYSDLVNKAKILPNA